MTPGHRRLGISVSPSHSYLYNISAHTPSFNFVHDDDDLVHDDDDQVREDPVREAVRRPLSYIETSPSLPSPLLKVMNDLGENIDYIDHD